MIKLFALCTGYMALSLAVIPVAVVFGIWFTFITAPIALFLAIRHWNSPRSLVRSSRARLIATVVLATLQLCAWAVYIYILFARP